MRFRIVQGIGPDRHLRARCGACGRVELFDPAPLLAQKLEGIPLADVSTRLRCRCGARQAGLEIWDGPADAADAAGEGAIYLFR